MGESGGWDDLSGLVEEWRSREFRPKSGDTEYMYPGGGYWSRKYDQYPPFELKGTLGETILTNNLFEAVDENGKKISEEDRRKEVEEFLYGKGEDSAWYEKVESSKLGKIYRSIFEWHEKSLSIGDLDEAWKSASVWSLDDGFEDFHEGDGVLDKIRKMSSRPVVMPVAIGGGTHVSSGQEPFDFEDVLFSIVSQALGSLEDYALISSRLRSLSTKMSEFLGMEITISPDVDLTVIDRGGVDLESRLGIPYLSSGQAQLFTIVTEMEMAAREISHVLIDEPELSLHDKFVSDLFEYMCEFSTSTGKQVICSTHSTTLAGLGLRNTVFVEGHGGEHE
jgi:hypothetical protein